MSHVIEPAASGRAKCRGCGHTIAKGELRFGERVPNPYGEGEATYWFHTACAACKRPEAFLSIETSTDTDDFLADLAADGLQHPRLPRIKSAERARSGRASCRHCREKIAADSWRIVLEIWDDGQGRFNPMGFIHAGCSKGYFGTARILDRILLFDPQLPEQDAKDIKAALT